ncbi:hypothetical protein NZNM25_01490 [Nitrosopumilus zosterae]|uniref:Uncharacterized protein n=1 Tax=Nitrosopumilus zosterae TaxID=718286 RepID=A0A2S2KPG4_9ARCH|nr:hypothetical protein [Nitrosopumilus zosterae]BDQ31145.1 hypothetical protein NZOSNM25_001256 [Nitrosopumilus zosterae]GBH33358.1 hypothetical protein NZNM25_01490 [Nitrosopumilus zosterae]
MTKFSAVIEINKTHEKETLEKISSLYSKSTNKRIDSKDSKIRYVLKVPTSDSKEILENNLQGINNLEIKMLESEPNVLVRLPRKISTWIMVGFFVVWIGISYVAFFISDNILDNLSNSQILVIQVSIALVISIWLFFYDKRTQEEIVDVLAKLDLRTSAMDENIKDLDKK